MTSQAAQSFRTEFTNRFGSTAADYRVRSRLLGRIGLPLAGVGLAVLIVGASMHSRVVVYIAIGMFFATVGVAFAANYAQAKFRKAAGAALGIRITIQGAPPDAPAAYMTWCKKRGLEPYPFRPKRDADR